MKIRSGSRRLRKCLLCLLQLQILTDVLDLPLDRQNKVATLGTANHVGRSELHAFARGEAGLIVGDHDDGDARRNAGQPGQILLKLRQCGIAEQQIGVREPVDRHWQVDNFQSGGYLS